MLRRFTILKNIDYIAEVLPAVGMMFIIYCVPTAQLQNGLLDEFCNV